MNLPDPIAYLRLWMERPFLIGGIILLCVASWLRYRLHEWQIDAEEEVKNSDTSADMLTRRLRFYRRSANFMFVVGAVALVAGVLRFLL